MVMSGWLEVAVTYFKAGRITFALVEKAWGK
jgi:hypothetical protein